MLNISIGLAPLKRIKIPWKSKIFKSKIPENLKYLKPVENITFKDKASFERIVATGACQYMGINC